MKNWNFSIIEDRQIAYDELDRTPYYQLKINEPSVSHCIGCGTCTATCIASQNNEDMNLRKLILSFSRGLFEDAKKMISSCRFCGKCSLVCPRGVNTRMVIMNIEKIINKNNY